MKNAFLYHRVMCERAFQMLYLKMKNFKNYFEAGSREENEPRLWNRNTHLGVDLKTILRNDRCVKTGKSYTGVLKRDVLCEEFHYEDHFTFVETTSPTDSKRNPHVFVGKFITITQKDDGSYRPNFKPMKMDEGFSIEKYAVGVCNELLWALEGLVEE